MERYKEKASSVLGKATKRCLSSATNDLRIESVAVEFTVNDKAVRVNAEDVSPSLSLARFLRTSLGLTGTKISCAQGRCGACTVAAEINGGRVVTVNACLVPVLHCRGWSITTVEGAGSCKHGLGAVQRRLAKHDGTQCGFCTPGMVMAMETLLKKGGELSDEAVESTLDGNICRCTGYRPILDAFKTFCGENNCGKEVDIEDVAECCKTNNDAAKSNKIPAVKVGDADWFYPRTVSDAFKVLQGLPSKSAYLIVAGHTGAAIFSGGPYDAFVDVSDIDELRSIEFEPELGFGAAVTISEAIAAMRAAAEKWPAEYGYCKQVAHHFDGVANQGVRDVGTLVGNLCLLRQSTAVPDFPSDVSLLLEAVGAAVTVASSEKKSATMTPAEFVQLQDLDRKIVTKITMPKLSADHTFRSYKVRRRRQNCQALVNGAFLLELRDGVVRSRPSIVFGGLKSKLQRAENAEIMLEAQKGGRPWVMKDQKFVDSLLKVLHLECHPGSASNLAHPAYRRHLALALFYKFILDVLGNRASPDLRSGALPLPRGPSSGKQDYKTDPSLYPINEPLPKLEADPQCTGETKYVDDLPLDKTGGELHGAFVVSTVAACELDEVDPAEALSWPGVVDFLDYRDIPGVNNCTRSKSQPEEIFSSGKIHYAGQAIGLIVATSTELAHRAAREGVRVTYKNRRKPVLDIEEALKMQEETQCQSTIGNDTDGTSSTTVEGQFRVGWQYHFHLETQSCLARPTSENGRRTFELESSTQWMDKVQLVAARALGVTDNCVAVKVRRLGGAYGAKISRPSQVAAACAVAADKLDRPVRVVMDLRSNMAMMGKRLPYLAKYRVIADECGKLSDVQIEITCDCGFTTNEATSDVAAQFAQNCYHADRWNVVPKAVKTDTAANTFCRAPGSTQGHAIIENIMQHLSAATGIDPLELRMRNLLRDGDALIPDGKFQGENPIWGIVEELKKRADYDKRRADVEKYNQGNRWKKRGLSLIPVRYPHAIPTTRFYVRLAVFHADATVAVSHGGIEMGQGINTKVAQVVAAELNIPVSQINVKAADNFASPNTTATDASNGTECVCAAAKSACEDLLRRMAPDREEGDDWVKLVHKCYRKGVDLTASHMGSSLSDDWPSTYDIWGAAATEVEVDALTGELNIRGVDLTEDVGTAVNPAVDVGQVEGGLVMSLGLWTTEEIRMDQDTGSLLTYDAWDYWPYSCKDIPERLNVHFYDGGRRDRPKAFLGAKATGEPCFLLGVGVLLAVRDAIDAVKKDLGCDPKQWYNLDGPATVERIQRTTGVTYKDFVV